MRILLWHVHGGWTDAFVQGAHEYLLPALPEGGPWGGGRGGREWPASVVDVHPDGLRDAEIDLVVLQRTEELAEVERLLGRRPGREVPAVFLEHNTPKNSAFGEVHALADQTDIPIVHVTHFNALAWDTGRAPTTVIEHGVRDPGHLYTGDLPHLGVVINEPVRRWRVTGTDLLPRFAASAHLDLFGMQTHLAPDALGLGGDALTVVGDLPTHELHQRLARCRAYLHPMRWTSLGLSLIEAMHAGMPVVVLAATEAVRAVPPEAGAISTDVDDLVRAARALIDDPDDARRRGTAAREWALGHYGLGRFLHDWDTVIHDVVESRPSALVGARAVQSSEGMEP